MATRGSTRRSRLSVAVSGAASWDVRDKVVERCILRLDISAVDSKTTRVGMAESAQSSISIDVQPIVAFLSLTETRNRTPQSATVKAVSLKYTKVRRESPKTMNQEHASLATTS
eukprot:m.200589 g.200589  ORF g.200589 m.200589 type:complete len:114 (+) comp32771_c1_seq2:2034-2375(+)